MLESSSKKRDAWSDPDDSNARVNISEKARLRKLKKSPEETEISGVEYQKRLKEFYNDTLHKSEFFSWAKDSKSFETSNLRSALNNFQIFESSKSKFQAEENMIEIKKIAKVNAQNSVVQSIDFHPKLKMMITCGFDKIANIFRVFEPSNDSEGKESAPKSIKKIYTERFPLTQANFISEEEILFCGKGRQLLSMNLQNSRIEEIASKMWMEKMGSNTKSFSFSPSYLAVLGEKAYAAILDTQSKQFFSEIILPERPTSSFIKEHLVYFCGSSGTCYVYDVRRSGLLKKVKAEGVGEGAVISSGENFYAVGGGNGILNLYHSRDDSLAKEFSQLTTAITSIAFSKDLMCFNSKWKSNSARIASLSNLHVFKNWPVQKTKLSSISSCKICSHTNIIAFGNEEGFVTTYAFKS